VSSNAFYFHQRGADMPSKTKQLAENALMLGIALVFLFLSTYTILGIVTIFFLPLPFLLLGLRRNVSNMVWISLAFTALGAVISGIPTAMIALLYSFLGSIMGIMYAKKEKALPAITAGAAVFFLGYVLMLAIATFVMNVDIKELFKQADQLRPQFLTEEQYAEAKKLAIMVLPAFFIIASFVQSWITHGIARLLGKRLGRPVPALPPIRQWNFPRSLLYYYFIAMIGILVFGKSMEGTFWETALYNLKTILDVIFMIQGLSFCLFALELYGWKRMTPVLIVSLFIFPFLTSILSLIGIFDLGIRLREKLETRVKRG
jgi:uncharacterized protein YybS (DUF2232 family)